MDPFIAIRCSGNVITEPLLSSRRPPWLHYFGLQAVLTKSLPNSDHIRQNIKFHNFAFIIFSPFLGNGRYPRLNSRHSREQVVANHVIT
jgi:hypothetical protein